MSTRQFLARWKWFISIFIIVVVAISVFAFTKLRPNKKAQSQVQYTTTKVTRGNITVILSASGVLELAMKMQIKPDSNLKSGRVVKILVKEGSEIRAGDPVAKVDDTEAKPQVAQAKANLEVALARLAALKAQPEPADLEQANASFQQTAISLADAQKNLERMTELYAKDLIARKDLESAQSQYNNAQGQYLSAKAKLDAVKSGPSSEELKSAESNLIQAQINLQMAELALKSTTIISPVSGTILEITIQMGEIVSSATPIATIAKLDPMYLQAYVDEVDIGQVKVGQQATASFETFPNKTFSGKVIKKSYEGQIQGNITTFPVTIELPNSEHLLLAGMNGDVEITITEAQNVLLVPNKAIKERSGSTQVEILSESKPLSWDIEIGVSDGVNTEIKAGLDEGDEVIVSTLTPSAGSTPRSSNGFPGGGLGSIERIIR